MARASASRTVSELFRSVRADRGRLVLAVTFALVSASTGIVTPLLVARLLTVMHESANLVPTVGALIGVVLAGAFAGGWSAYLLSTVGERAVAAVRLTLLRHVVRLPVATIRRFGIGDLLSRLGGDAAQLRTLTDTAATALPVSAFLVVAYLIVMGLLDWLLLLVVLVTFALASLAIRSFLRRMREGTVAQQTAVGRLAQTAQSVLDSVTTIKACAAESRAVAPIGMEIHEAASAAIRTARSQAAISPLTGLAQQVAIVSVLAVGGAQLASGRLSASYFIAFLMYLFQLVNPLMTLAQGVGRIQTGLAAATRLDVVLAAAPETVTPGAMATAAVTHETATVESGTGSVPAVVLDDVRVRIGETPILSGATMEIGPTGMIGIVGASGAGKSTLFDVLEGFTVPDAGRVLLFGTDLRQWPLAEARQRMALVEQDCTPLRATVRFNLCLGVTDDRLATVTDDDLLAVLSSVGLDAVVSALPGGLDAVLGETARLSGGEMQRLAIARALLTDAELLLLDEPTSALDGANERRVVSVLADLARTRAVVVVAHRVSTVRDADTIVVVDAGRVIATGDHATLLARSPNYRALVRGWASEPADPAPVPEQASGSVLQPPGA